MRQRLELTHKRAYDILQGRYIVAPKVRWQFLVMAGMLGTLLYFVVPLLIESYIAVHRSEFIACFEHKQPSVLYLRPSTSPNLPSTASSTPESTDWGFNDPYSPVQAIYASSTLLIDQNQLPSDVQMIELLGIDGLTHTLWENEKESK